MKETKKYIEKQANFIIDCALDKEWTISDATWFARDYLGKYNYSEDFIVKVCQIIIKELMA